MTLPQPDPARRPSGLQISVWLGLVAGFLFLSLRDYHSFQVGTVRDETLYILLARSLVYGDRYGLDVPSEEAATTKFPFGYPLILALPVALFPGDLEILRWPSLIATLANAALLFWGWPWFSRLKSHWWALGVTGIFLWSPTVVGHSRVLMTEPFFTAFCLAAFLLLERGAASRPAFGPGLWAGLAMAGVVFTRTAGLILLPCAAVYLLLRQGRRAWRPLAAAAASLLAAAVLVVAATPVEWRSLPGFVLGYGSQLADAVITLERRPTELASLTRTELRLVRLHEHVADVRGLVIPFGGGEAEAAFFAQLGIPSPMPVVAYALLAVTLAGFALWRAREGVSMLWLFTLAYGGLLLVWNWRGQRLLYPVIPQIYFALLLAVEAILVWLAARLRRWPPYAPRLVLGGLGLALVAVNGAASLRVPDSRQHVGDLATRTAWVRANLPADARLMTEEPFTDYLYGGRKTVQMLEQYESAAALERHLAAQSVDYILIAPHAEWQVAYRPAYSEDVEGVLPFMAQLAGAGRIRLVYTSADQWIKVYKVESLDDSQETTRWLISSAPISTNSSR